MNPNPNYHVVSLADRFKAYATILKWPVIALSVILQRKGRGRMDLDEEIYLAKLREVYFARYPLSMFRIAFAGDKFVRRAMIHPRFAGVQSNLYQRVEKSTFAGYWVFRHSFTNSLPPSSSDVVLCYIHGGGYALWQPGTYMSLMLAIIEAVMKRGFTISVFALDYSLIPEAGFPTQVGQLAAMYRYIGDEMGIDYQKVALMGDSAGAHLILSFLTHLHSPISLLSPNASQGLPRPGAGVFLISPWVTLDTSNATFKTNDGMDMLNKYIVDLVGGIWLSASEATSAAETKPYYEFLQPTPRWAEILPKKVFVSAGAVEVFLGDIGAMVEAMRGAGASVQYSIKERKGHDWQFTDCLRAEKAWLQVPLEKESPVTLDGAEELAEALVSVAPSD